MTASPTFSNLTEPALVVGVGASAGGLEALESMFRNMPEHTGMSFVVVQHQSPSFESRMEELLARQTRLTVCMAESGARLRPDTIHLAPADKHLAIIDGLISLRSKDPSHAFALPIDELFSSLADCFGARAVAVVLSGTGRDGSRGIVDVHRAGGVVLAQQPESAKFDGMPRNAVESGVVDEVLPPDQLGEVLLRQLREPNDGVRGACSPAVEAAVREILGLLRKHHGIDFTHYKPSTVMRRVERRLMLGQSGDIDAYLALLRNNPGELNALYHDLLIGVTSFFRDRETFTLLEQQIIPTIVSAASKEEEVRAWVAGCATGEEAYALAMLFREQLAQLDNAPKLTVFATDVHGASLETAALGRYPSDQLAAVGPARLERWFEPDGAGFYRVRKELRDSVVFARHDVLSDAPFTRLDLVSCRNLLIYLKVPAQTRVLSLFHFGLKQNAFLFLGRSESVAGMSEVFDSFEPSAKIYRKVSDQRPSIANYVPLTRLPAGGIDVGARRATESRLLRLYDRLLEKHVPPSVLVDERHELVHCFAGAETYLHVPIGRMSSNILDVVDPALRAALSAALHQAATRRASLTYDGIEFRPGTPPLRLRIDTLIDTRSGSVAYHVAFEPREQVRPAEAAAQEPADVSRDYLDSLESQLQATRESLQATVEALQASNEELQATNEELLASNEQLQSTNEELHSVNEELHSVNAENERRIKELTELNNDIDNLLQSIDVGVLFVDRELRIRRFTQKAADVFNLLETDVGRRFPSFAQGSAHGDLVDDIARVIAGKSQAAEREVEADGSEYLLRVLPYSNQEGIGGAVLTLVDVSPVKEREAKLRQLSAIVETSEDAIVAEDLEGTVLSWNQGAERLYGYSEREVLGQSIELIVPPDRRDELVELRRRLCLGERIEPFETVRRHKNGVLFEISLAIAPLLDEHGRVVGSSAIGRDITRRRRAEAQVQRALEQRDRFIALLSHELRNPLMGVTMAVSTLHDDKRDADRQRRALQVLERQTSHMARLLDDLVDVARARRGAISMRKELFDLRDGLDTALDTVRERAWANGVELSVEAPDEPMWVYGDAQRLQQLEVNLLSNAVKFTPSGKRVWLKLAIEQGEVRIAVIDEGIGLRPGTENEIFEPFYQDDRATGGGGRGMGLGLALVRGLAEAHGGSVVARSDGPGRGCAFLVRLPLAHAPASVRRRSEGARTRRRVLIVEDEDDNRQLLTLLLSDRGYEVTAAATGAEALDVLKGMPIEVALVDLGLPDMSGLEVAEKARQLVPRDALLLVALTGQGRAQDRDDVMAAGFDEHLMKPVRPERILHVIERRE